MRTVSSMFKVVTDAEEALSPKEFAIDGFEFILDGDTSYDDVEQVQGMPVVSGFIYVPNDLMVS